MLKHPNLLKLTLMMVLNLLAIQGQASTDSNIILEYPLQPDIIIPVVIDNKEFHFVLDTGSSLMVLNEESAKRISHIQPLKGNDLVKHSKEDLGIISTVNGSLSPNNLNIIKSIPFSIGTKKINENRIWLLADLTTINQALGTKIDGLIGVEAFREINWQIDNKNKKIILTETPSAGSKYQYCTGYEDSYNRSPRFWLKFNETDIPFYIDTGAGYSYITSDIVKSISKTKNSLITNPSKTLSSQFSGLSETHDYIVKGLMFDNKPLKSIRLGESTSEPALGMDFLSRFDRYAFYPSRMQFCYDARTLEKNVSFPIREIKIRNFNNQIEVFFNNNDDLKAYGLMNNDLILAVNGKDTPSTQIDSVRKALAETPKTKLNLKIKRNNKEINLKL